MKKIIVCCLWLLTSICIASQDSKKLTIILDWFPNPDHAPLIVAQEKGFFKEQGIQVELIGPADPNDPPKLVAAGKADIGITYEPQFMQQVDQGLPLIAIGTLIDKPLNCLVTLKESGINSLSKLKNKRIGSSIGGLTGIMLTKMLTEKGLSQKDIELINVRYNLTQALLSRRVDAVTGMNRNFEVPQLELTDHQVNVFFPEEHGIPNYSELIFIIHQAHVRDPRIPRFLAALKKAVAYLDTHQQPSWQAFIKKYPEANNAVNKEAWLQTIPYFAEDPARIRHKEWETFSKFMAENKMIKKTQPLSRYVLELPRATPFSPTS